MISLKDLEIALDSCMSQQPTTGEEAALPRDASFLAEVVATLWYYKREAVAISDMTDPQLDAFKRWFTAT